MTSATTLSKSPATSASNRKAAKAPKKKSTKKETTPKKTTLKRRRRKPVADALSTFLAAHADASLDPATVDQDRLKAWAAEISSGNRTAARSAYLVGRHLAASRPKKRNEVAAWTDAQAKTLGLSPRSIRLYIQVARAVDALDGNAVTADVLDRALRDVPRALAAVAAGKDPDAKREPVPVPVEKRLTEALVRYWRVAEELPVDKRAKAWVRLVEGLRGDIDDWPDVARDEVMQALRKAGRKSARKEAK